MAAKLLIAEAPMQHADIIVVLSGSAAYKERASEAARLYLEGRSQKVVLTNDNLQGGWSISQQRNPFFYERSLDELMAAGLAKESVEVLTPPVAGTRDEALLLRQYAEKHNLHSLLIVTSAYHSRRALWVFRRVFRNSGVDIGLVAVRPGTDSAQPFNWWLSLQGWKSVPVEYFKILYYALIYN